MSSQGECLNLERVLKESLFIPHHSVAVRMLSQNELDSAPAWLERFRRPGHGAPEKMIACQVMAMVRVYGWKILLTPEAVNCPSALLSLGWAAMSPEYKAGEWPVTPYNQSKKARSRRVRVVPMLPLDKYAALSAAPLSKCPFEPHVVVIYGTPAQAMRLVQGALFAEGGVLESAAAGGAGCSQYITKTMQTGECRFNLPGNGDRILGHVEEHQMSFSPAGQGHRQIGRGDRAEPKGGPAIPPAQICARDIQNAQGLHGRLGAPARTQGRHEKNHRPRLIPDGNGSNLCKLIQTNPPGPSAMPRPWYHFARASCLFS